MRRYVAGYKARTGRMLGKKYRPDSWAGGWITPSRRAAIYERDDWTCQLCAAPVDRDAHWNADLAPSLDHIVPVALGGGHDDDNLRCAHRVCNSKRGAGDVAA